MHLSSLRPRFGWLFLALIVFSAPIHAEPQNISLLKQDIFLYHDSGAYLKELSKEIEKARQFLRAKVKENQEKSEKKRLAMVLDIDETSLSNYNNIRHRDFNGDRKLISQEIQNADAPAIQPTMDLFNEAKKLGVDVFFVTGRYQSELEVTKKNLIKAGYEGYRGIYLRPDVYEYDSIIPFKSNARSMIEQQGYTIIVNIGDQYSDLIGGHAERGFKLPNPFYFLP